MLKYYFGTKKKTHDPFHKIFDYAKRVFVPLFFLCILFYFKIFLRLVN